MFGLVGVRFAEGEGVVAVGFGGVVEGTGLSARLDVVDGAIGRKKLEKCSTMNCSSWM